MTREQILKACPIASEDTIRETLAYHSRQLVARLDSPKPQPDRRRQSEDRSVETRAERFGYVVAITSHRKRKLDGHDNLRSAHKPLVDRITEKLGFKSDDDERLTWEYCQHVTRGRPGTHLTITAYET